MRCGDLVERTFLLDNPVMVGGWMYPFILLFMNLMLQPHIDRNTAHKGLVHSETLSLAAVKYGETELNSTL